MWVDACARDSDRDLLREFMMPVSEDELDPRIHSSLSQNGDYRYTSLSKAEQRKVSSAYLFYICILLAPICYNEGQSGTRKTRFF